MKSLKKLLSYVILILFVFGMVSMLFFFLPKNDNTVTVPEQDSGFSVNYLSVNEDVSDEIFELLFLKKGSYPKKYEIGMSLSVSDLKGKMEKASFDGEPCYVGSGFDDPDVKNKSYEFYGWFLDEDFTQEFDGVLGDNETGDITLYAKITTSIWTEAY